MNKKDKYLITGGSGFLGQELIKRLLKMGYTNLRIVARNEGNLMKLKQQFPEIEIITGDIANPFICDKACKDVNGIFHLAAFKHVGLAETQTVECVNSNVIGTMNLLEATRKSKPKFILGISTDKVVQVSGVYGATKFLQDALFREYETVNSDTKYRLVRYGNILYSTGSVLCIWKDKLLQGKDVMITNVDATRFYWTIKQAIDLIFDCLKNATNSEAYINDMKSVRMGDLLNAMVDKYAKGDIIIKHKELQRGENMHEKLTINGLNSFQTKHYTKKELIKLI